MSEDERKPREEQTLRSKWYEHDQVVPLAFEATTDQRLEFRDCLSNWKLLRYDKDAGYWFALPYALVCVIRHRVDIMRHYDATLVSRPI